MTETRPSLAAAPAAVVARAPSRGRRRPSVSASALAVVTGSEMNGPGVRVGLDFLRFGGFELGIAAQALALEGNDRLYGNGDMGGRQTLEMTRSSYDLLATLRYTLQVGRFALHPQLGIGGGLADHRVGIYQDRVYSHESSPETQGVRAEAALAASFRLRRSWSLEALIGTGAATYTGTDDNYEDRSAIWLDGINTASIGVRFTP
jgi:hypothetical protein